jgi:UDP-N-acetylglucosamine transferase subunit ALG13
VPPLAAREAGAPIRALVMVGTDHHPFDRLIGWVGEWLGRHPEQAPGFFVQAGTTSVRPPCSWSPFLDTDQLTGLLNTADVLICHGGPASIAEAWSRGQVPIAIPRQRRLGEHVDDHQVDFCAKVAEQGRVRLAQTHTAFMALLEEATRDVSAFRASGLESNVEDVVARFGTLMDDLVSQPRRRRLRGLARQRSVPMTSNDYPVVVSEPVPGVASAERGTSNATRQPDRVGLAGMAQEEKE